MSDFPQPRRKPGGEPCGECHIQPGETCDICGAIRPAAEAEAGGVTSLECAKVLRDAMHDAKQAVECMEAGDWLRADILLKLAIDQISDAGVLP